MGFPTAELVPPARQCASAASAGDRVAASAAAPIVSSSALFEASMSSRSLRCRRFPLPTFTPRRPSVLVRPDV